MITVEWPRHFQVFSLRSRMHLRPSFLLTVLRCNVASSSIFLFPRFSLLSLASSLTFFNLGELMFELLASTNIFICINVFTMDEIEHKNEIFFWLLPPLNRNQCESDVTFAQCKWIMWYNYSDRTFPVVVIIMRHNTINISMKCLIWIYHVCRWRVIVLSTIDPFQAKNENKCNQNINITVVIVSLLPPAYVRTTGGYVFTGVCLFGGGSQVQVQVGGAPVSDFWGGGYPVSDFRGGGTQSQIFWGGVPGLSKGKNFWHQIWLDTCSDWEKNFLSRNPPPPQLREKFLTPDLARYMFRLGKKIFVEGPPPPPVKGKIFDTRFGLIHVQTGKKNFCQGTPPPPGIARNCYGYAAGGMPLAFTQEDFLVVYNCQSSVGKRLHHEALAGGNSQVTSKCISTPRRVHVKARCGKKHKKTLEVPKLYRLMHLVLSRNSFINILQLGKFVPQPFFPRCFTGNLRVHGQWSSRYFGLFQWRSWKFTFTNLQPARPPQYTQKNHENWNLRVFIFVSSFDVISQFTLPPLVQLFGTVNSCARRNGPSIFLYSLVTTPTHSDTGKHYSRWTNWCQSFTSIATFNRSH